MPLALSRWLAGLCFCVVSANQAAAETDVTIGYLEQRVARPPVLSNLDPVPDDEGLAGARLGIDENATTGKFLKQTYRLESRIVDEGADVEAAARDLLSLTPFLVVNAPAAELLKTADIEAARDAILFNAGAPDDALRDDGCRANLLHTLPSRAMLADALAQFAVQKRWQDWVLIAGSRDGDMAFAEALEQAAAKFGVRILARKTWAFDADMRRNAAAEVPLFMQDMPAHDLVAIADEAGDFGRYVAYHTWEPRPVVGSEGLVPAAWSASVEQHGAAQLQGRFSEATSRDMRPVDYAAWAAVRAVGEAVARTGSGDAAMIRDYLFSDRFELGGFKGRPLTFRRWNGQMRQPIPLSHERAVVALAPLEGFLHQFNELDTLGLDQPESRCTAFGE